MKYRQTRDEEDESEGEEDSDNDEDGHNKGADDGSFGRTSHCQTGAYRPALRIKPQMDDRIGQLS